MSIPSYTTCWDRVVPGDVILYFYVNSDGFFLQKGVFPCLWPKCWSLGAGAGSPHMGRGRRSPVLPSGCCGPPGTYGRSWSGDSGVGAAKCLARGEGAEPGGRGCLFLLVDQGLSGRKGFSRMPVAFCDF